MRVTTSLFFVLVASAPACAQATSGAASSVNISNPSSTTSTNRLITTPTVVAPGLAAAGVETCLGSASGGVSVMGTGVTLGRTIPDEGCTIRLSARQLYAFGYVKAALALMCQDPHVAEAMASVGEPCPIPFAEIGARPNPRFAELPTGSIDRAPASARPFKGKPDAAVVQGPVAEAKGFTPEEERWFAFQDPR